MLAPMLLSVLLGQPPGSLPDGTAWNQRYDRLGDLLPPGAVARFGNTRFRHGAEILEMAVSPNGKFVVTRAKDDAEAKLWDVATGRQLARTSVKDTSVAQMTFLTDSTVALLADSTDVLLWATGREAEKLAPELLPEKVSAMATSADGKLWAVGGEKAIHILEAGAPKQVKQTLATAVPPLGLTFSPDGKWLAAESPNAVSLWNLATGKRVRSYTAGDRPVARFNATSDRLYCLNSATIRLLTLDSDEDDATFELVNENGGLADFVLSADGKELTVLHDSGRVFRIDAKTGKETGKPVDAPGVVAWRGARLTRDGKRAVSRREDQRWVSWDTATGKGDVPDPLPGLNDLRVSADGKTVVCQADGDVFRAWDAADGKPRGDARPRGKDPSGGSGWDATGERVLYENDQKELVCVRVKDGQILAKLPTASEGGRLWAFVGGDPARVVRFTTAATEVYDLDGKRPTRSFPYVVNDWGEARFSPDGRTLILAGKKDETAVYEWKTGQLRMTVKTRASQIKFLPDGRTVGLGDDSGFLTLIDTVTGRELKKMSMTGSGYTCFDFSPDGKRAVTACRGSNRLLEVWDLATGEVVGELPGPATGSVMAVAYLPDGRHIVSCGTDGCAYIWDARYRKPPEAHRRHFEFATLAGAVESLASHDAEMAHQAIAFLVERPADAVAELRKTLPAATGPTAEELAKAVGQLSSKEFAERDAGKKALVSAGAAAEAAIRAEAKAPASPESGRIAGELLTKLERGYSSPSDVRAARAVEVLDRIGTAEARKLLGEWAAGAPLAALTTEAKAALARK